MIRGLDEKERGFEDDTEECAYDESEDDAEDEGLRVHMCLLREKKGGGVSLSYPRYCGSRESEEPLACQFALWHFEVDIEAAVYSECPWQVGSFAEEDEVC